MKPIVLDIETSGLDFVKCGIWQIGAIDLNTGDEFLEEARIDDEDKVEEEALMIIGKTEEELRNSNKQSQKQLILNFLEWTRNCSLKIILGHNIGWDLTFIQNKCLKYGIHDLMRKTIGFKGLDTYSISQLKYLELNGNYAINEDSRGKMDLKQVLEFCGLEDNRKQNEGGKITEGTPHNALEDCKLTAECFSRLVYGKNLFPEFNKFEIPEVLRK